MSYLHYLCLFEYSDVQQILCCVFVLFVFVLYPMLPVSLDCPLDCPFRILYIHAFIEPKAPIFRINHTINTSFYYIHVRGILIFSREINTEVLLHDIVQLTV